MISKRNKHSDKFHAPFPANLRRLMERDSCTQKDVAESLNKSRQTVSCYCDGSSSPDWETIIQLAAFFHVSTDYLLGLTTVEAPNVELQAIAAYTGLSEAAIENLHREQEGRDQDLRDNDGWANIDVLNQLICYDYVKMHNIARSLSKAASFFYMQERFRIDGRKGEIFIESPFSQERQHEGGIFDSNGSLTTLSGWASFSMFQASTSLQELVKAIAIEDATITAQKEAKRQAKQQAKGGDSHD